MTVMGVGTAEQHVQWVGCCRQVLMVVLMNVPTMSFGLAMGWVSLASGETGESGGAGWGLVLAAGSTFAAELLAVPLAARALAAGRKWTVVGTSLAFVVCWSLKLSGSGWWVVMAARGMAGVAGAGAWAAAPLLAQEMCVARARGAAVSSLGLAHNLGVLLMLLAADARLSHRTILWCCLALSAAHALVFLFVPESPAYLAAAGRTEEARLALAWLRGRRASDPALASELAALPPPEEPVHSPVQLARDMLRDRRRRRAFLVATVAVVGQEACGLLALQQFAEHVFVLARDEPAMVPVGEPAAEPPGAVLGTPARHAVMLGAVQLVAAAVALYLVERVGRRPLIAWSALVTGGCLALAAALLSSGALAAGWTAVALGGAVAADSAGLQPAPYALLADMFHYQYRGCALLLISCVTSAGNALEVVVFPAVAAAGGLLAALALAATLTLAYTAFAFLVVPETRGKTPEQIYDALCPRDKADCAETGTKEAECKETVCKEKECTNM